MTSRRCSMKLRISLVERRRNRLDRKSCERVQPTDAGPYAQERHSCGKIAMAESDWSLKFLQVGVDHDEHQSRRRMYHAYALVGSISACHGAVAYTAGSNAIDPADNAAIQHPWSSDSSLAAADGDAAHGPT